MGTVDRWIIPGEKLWLPLNRWAVEYWLRCVAPYGLFRYGLVPLLFLPLGTSAWLAVLVNTALAEIVANVITFVTIAPNHTGEDLSRFDRRAENKETFYLRQVIASANYTTGSDVIDWLQGGLNYQIEHHLFPDLPLLKYKQYQPRVKALCERHGVPYVQENVFRRISKCYQVVMGRASVQRAIR